MPIEFFTPRLLGPKSWGEELLVGHTPHYTLKVMRMNAGATGPLQFHEEKDETFHLLSGRAFVRYDPGDGRLLLKELLPGMSVHVPPRSVHQVEAIEDCLIIEASTPHFDDRVNMEDRYR